MNTTTIDATVTTQQQQEQEHRLVDLDPGTLREWLANDDILLVDVREDFEHATAHIAGSQLHALSGFDPDALRAEQGNRRVVFYCRTGRRSAEAATRFGHCTDGNETTYHLAGGIERWTAAGLSTERASQAPPLDIMRQVQLIVGLLVVVGTALGAFLSPWFLVLSGFVGAGLFWAGATGTCALAMMLGRMPWNRVEGLRTCGACTS